MGCRASRTVRSGPHLTLVVVLPALLLALTLLLVSPAKAQDTEETTAQVVGETTAAMEDEVAPEQDRQTNGKSKDTVANTQETSDKPEQEVQGGGQRGQSRSDEQSETTTARASGPLAQAVATLGKSGKIDRVNLITIDAANCTMQRAKNADVTIRVDDKPAVVVSDNRNRIRFEDERIVIEPNGDVIMAGGGPFRSVDAVGTVVNSTGIVCFRGDNANLAGNNDLDDLDCDVLLRRFRNEGSGQYGDVTGFSDVEIRDRIIVCLEQEVDPDTAADEDLPDTGGLPLLGIAALGIASAIAGVSLVRGGRRED